MEEEDDQYEVGLTGEDVVFLYDVILSKLSVNSKSIINDLTVIAGERRMHGAGIADVICDRILEVPGEQKLPSLYLLDSIVKKVGREYIKYFSARLPQVFCETYKQVHPNMHPAMSHLFFTWSIVFPLSVLQKIEAELQFSSSADHQSLGSPLLGESEYLRPTHGIHTYTQYLEARRQLGHEITDSSFNPPRGVSMTSKIYAQKHSTDFEEFNSDDEDADIYPVGPSRLAPSSSRSDPDATRLLPNFGGSIGRLYTPYEVGRVSMDNSPGRRTMPLDSGIDYRTGGVRISCDKTVDWKRNFVSGDSMSQVRHPPAVRFSNGVDLDRTRALINAYGIDRRTEMTKHTNVEKLRLNGISKMTWKNSEEEEFDWENMRPTLADHDRKDVVSSPLPSTGSFRNPALLSSHLGQVRPNQPQFLEVTGSFIDDVPSSTDGLNSKVCGISDGPTPLQSSSIPSECWKSVRNVDRSSTHKFSATKGGNKPLVPLEGSEILCPLITQNQGQAFGSREDSVSLEYVKLEQQISPEPASAGVRPSTYLHSSPGGPTLQTYQPNRQFRGQLDTLSGNNLLVNQNVDSSSFSDDNLNTTKSILQNPMIPNFGQQSRPTPSNQNLMHEEMLSPHPLPQDMRHHLAPLASVVGPSTPLASRLQHGYEPGHMGSVGTIIPNLNMQSPIPTRLHRLPLPLPRGLPGATYMLPVSQPSSGDPKQPVGGDYSNLFSSLMAQGVIALNLTPVKEDPVGLEFDPNLLKVRHDSAIKALYFDLPRQCTTCGLRFKVQEAHSSHMDWHVTKNRLTKNHKQKPSRKWFVIVNMWLTDPEALETDSAPNLLPSEDIVGKKDDEELAVPADEDQKYCALCGEAFDDFYCDETDEWMYKEAVYMNAPSGSTTDIGRSQFGSIVHAKCRSETDTVSENMKKRNLDSTEEDGQPKRMCI